MERLPEGHLGQLVKIINEQHPGIHENLFRYAVAKDMLSHYLGAPWCDSYLKPDQTKVPGYALDGRKFQRTDYETSEDSFRHLERMERLSQILFRLQDVEGIEGRISSIQKGSVEATYAELEFAWLFLQCAIPIRFRHDDGVRGGDYDFDAGAAENQVSCEVKCKLETTELGENTITNALITARKQVPADRAAIIGVKIPESWIKDQEIEKTFKDALDTFFRNSRRVVAVVVRWEQWITLPNGQGRLIQYPIKTFVNERSRHLSDEVHKLIRQLSQPSGGRWVSLTEIVLASIRKRS